MAGCMFSRKQGKLLRERIKATPGRDQRKGGRKRGTARLKTERWKWKREESGGLEMNPGKIVRSCELKRNQKMKAEDKRMRSAQFEKLKG